MLSKTKIKFIRSLQIKKYRQAQEMFVVEGTKIVNELLHSHFDIHSIYAVKKGMQKVLDSGYPVSGTGLFEVSDSELKQISALATPNEVLCIARIPEQGAIDAKEIKNGLSLALDNIRDPGNLGMIIRIADWFGIKNVLCSEQCVDVYNPKVVQATMGSLTRVKVHELDLTGFLSSAEGLPVYGALLDGEDIHQIKLEKTGIIMLGNESVGISDALMPFITRKIMIPSFGGAESLNVAAATAIICAEFKRA